MKNHLNMSINTGVMRLKLASMLGTPMHTTSAPVHGYGACMTPYSASTQPCVCIFQTEAGYGICTSPYTSGTHVMYGITDSDINDNHPGTHESVPPGCHQVPQHFTSQGGCIPSTVHSLYCICSNFPQGVQNASVVSVTSAVSKFSSTVMECLFMGSKMGLVCHP
jgi:hypothetical protein